MTKREDKTKNLNHSRKKIINLNFFLFVIAFLFVGIAQAQVTTKPFLPKSLLPLPFKKQLSVVNKEFNVAYGMRQDSVMRDIRNYNFEEINQFLYKSKDYEFVFRIPFWIAMDSARYSKLIPELILKLTDTTFIGLTNAADVTIWSRVKSGDMKPNPLNYQIDDDIYTVGGRASWILKRLSKNEFGIVRPSLTEKELLSIQKQWIKWLNTLVQQK